MLIEENGMDGLNIATRRRFVKASAMLGAVVIVVAACGGGAASPSASGAAPSTGASAPPASQAGEPVEIEWFVGLGTGENEEQIEPEKAVVKAFNDSQDQVELILTVVDNTEASDTLATRIAAGDSPDIIGPIGIRGLQSFGDQLLDLSPYVTPEDTAGMDPALVDAYKVDGKQIGIPMAVYPSFFYYNKDLFEEAGVAEPPHAVGEQYEGKDWNWETVRELAKKLTVDANGNDATSADFDPENIVQWGLDAQFTENDARAWSTIFGGSGSVVGDDGKTAQWPDNWKTGLKFYYDSIWKDHIIPNKTAVDSLADGNTFKSGRIAMDVVHQWYTCCILPDEGQAATVPNWDIAVLPEGPDGNVTSKLHADTIGIMDSTENPEAAYSALSFLTKSPELITTWGAMPAIESQRDAFFASQSERFAPLEIDWDVSTEMLGYPDNPSHEAFMPNFAEADSANKDLGSKLWTTPDLDFDATIEEHIQTLQGLFDTGG
jgi:multiple sugar transport system substrate-binding protein